MAKKAPRRQAAPEVISSAPAYQPPNAGITAPGGPYGPPASAGPSANGYGAPPPQAPKNPFVNAAWLWQNGNQQGPMREIRATVQGMRPAVDGANSKYGAKRGWFLDLVTAVGPVTARMNEGDQRHQRLWAAFGANFQGKQIVLRLPHPGDATKALWTLDAA